MNFLGIEKTETLILQSEGKIDTIHSINISLANDEPAIYVYSSDYSDWVWKFYYNGNTEYESIKSCVIAMAIEFDDIFDVIDALDDIFSQDFDGEFVYLSEDWDNEDDVKTNNNKYFS